ncbi:bacillithiol system redox-active protein YtxJ [Metabacillus arenae]|uniref:Bacillithiol system redox-active protein YtxJ n=1 Tax=Metabacillus arenae TaxID=2771434 RepID=A0A926RX11_9BACI|nr:bacillithiol system redox-active protein YtxJ [Metabacillus arenae]MBD1380150.1 bacillithiol system redox-active protein YtxJ [Metabacillus arenae]
MEKINVKSIEDFLNVIDQHTTFLLFKNSLTCPISSSAFEEFSSFAESQNEVHVYYLNVQKSRELSNYIANNYHVKHESPQVLLFKGKEVIWHTSHWNIKKEILKQQVLSL